MRSFSPLLGLKVSTFRAVISMLSPVCGLRPRREALRRMRKWPKPTIFTSSPFSKQRKMMSNTDSTTAEDCRFDRPWLATAFTRSFFVTGTTHLLSGCSSWRVPGDEPWIPFLGQLTQGRHRSRAVGECTHAHAVQAVDRPARRRCRRRAGGTDRRGGAFAAHLDLEPVEGELLGQRDGIGERQGRLHDHARPGRLGGETLGAQSLAEGIRG